jgi:hypothetical protein
MNGGWFQTVGSVQFQKERMQGLTEWLVILEISLEANLRTFGRGP